MDQLIRQIQENISPFILWLENYYISDSIQIVILSFLIYRLLRSLPGTQALQASQFLIIFGFLYFISWLLDFGTLFRVLQQLIQDVLIVVVIIFQPELRRILFGTRSKEERNFFLKLFSRQINAQDWLPEIIKCLQLHCQLKLGSLLAVEMDDDLQEQVQDKGQNIDARISSNLLTSIFQTKSPLHDGAVIISKGRIWRCGVVLPLTHREDLPHHFGTRHRAAIGFSETSDVLVFVVSEETGKPSIARHGQIYRFENMMELESQLQQLIADTQKKGA